MKRLPTFMRAFFSGQSKEGKPGCKRQFTFEARLGLLGTSDSCEPRADCLLITADYTHIGRQISARSQFV